jgi:hypothetical protein
LLQAEQEVIVELQPELPFNKSEANLP